MRDKKGVKCAKYKVYNLKKYKLYENDVKLLRQLLQNPEGLRVNSLSKSCNIKKVTIYKRLGLLKEKGLVENVFPIWRIVHGQVEYCRTLLKSSNIFELHNISYVVKLLKTPEWWSKRKNHLIRLKEWQFKEISWGNGSSNPYHQLINDNFVIQCYPESLIIIARKRYYSNNPYETITKAISDVLDLLEWFCERFRFDLFSDGIPHIEVRNNDFNRMNDALANEIKRSKGSFLVEIDKRRKVWVDMSEPFGKEANYPEGQERLEIITKDYLTKESLLPSEITQMIGEVTQNQLMFNDNFVSHVEAIKTLSKSVKELSKEVRRLKNARVEKR